MATRMSGKMIRCAAILVPSSRRLFLPHPARSAWYQSSATVANETAGIFPTRNGSKSAWGPFPAARYEKTSVSTSRMSARTSSGFTVEAREEALELLIRRFAEAQRRRVLEGNDALLAHERLEV